MFFVWFSWLCDAPPSQVGASLANQIGFNSPWQKPGYIQATMHPGRCTPAELRCFPVEYVQYAPWSTPLSAGRSTVHGAMRATLGAARGFTTDCSRLQAVLCGFRVFHADQTEPFAGAVAPAADSSLIVENSRDIVGIEPAAAYVEQRTDDVPDHVIKESIPSDMIDQPFAVAAQHGREDRSYR